MTDGKIDIILYIIEDNERYIDCNNNENGVILRGDL